MSETNLKIWRAVEETAPSATKRAQLTDRSITTINGTYVAKVATEVFGPCGTGWGYQIAEDRFDEGAPILGPEGVICKAVMHTVRLELWYINDAGQKAWMTHYGHTPYITPSRGGGPVTDFEAPKKSVTDALKKCLSMLGVCADVYLGHFDDEGYVETATQREALERAGDVEEETQRQRDEFHEWAEREIGIYPKTYNPGALQTIHHGHLKKAKRQCQLLGLDYDAIEQRFVDAFNKRHAELTADQNQEAA